MCAAVSPPVSPENTTLKSIVSATVSTVTKADPVAVEAVGGLSFAALSGPPSVRIEACADHNTNRPGPSWVKLLMCPSEVESMQNSIKVQSLIHMVRRRLGTIAHLLWNDARLPEVQPKPDLVLESGAWDVLSRSAKNPHYAM